MFLELIALLTQFDSGFGVLNYLTLRAVLAMLASLLISLALGHYFIKKLHLYQIGQVIRTDGPQSHLSKSGTPTMGGVMILSAFIISSLVWADWSNHYLWIVLATAVIFGAVGFVDDYLKIKRKSSDGLSSRKKILGQSLGAIIIGIWIVTAIDNPIQTQLLIPFFKDIAIPLGIVGFLVLAYFVIVGSSNAVNLTDGLDGLAIMPVILISSALALFSYISGNYNFANYLNMPFMPGTGELFVICSALVGASLGFLWFNTYPAEIFMGDVGSLALGAILAVIAILLRQEILLFIMGGVFVAETLSVIIQVAYYKRTKKRFFLMAPIHHHFEKKGISEPKIIVRFWMVTLILVLVSLASIKIR
ncbi:phospho-N-acetylmuramoyl-pentapeptide-transferase [Candidatus Thioglobus sp.]|jgi:phospho-N-acetylmuramoyl-pentapeptide-transferase|uniref:phospho-N-acetylmuramoyl-pentapeptide- transferase n=1 Tax=Candidatus Thioglobus sp. TaxID=2026721 RepID=UPI001D86284E|nr:phospho-N-acetylmuramoyl-pentapeptide-transferase [Candidatus Thioglobus sp.]MBT3277207.1 phospho-N-acetylmuramoyl-pentapeptide-transferase [Candidatus Thioglobus sp.]MBT3447186.1 phospho-N-acetylmuramoyl-pentapeptide-transferase [Candidatus Thioglobus sp.]MBT4182247.1 phospho-N-acetylmuramoyl-pentapeptide-transferase [Candidatus Thioglobus sp.]MBT4422523.1 phospho-N-acetylmuramoyl-pentapeptide-transferase [Candidatus Thioglobus sp.]MBT4746441.1 phospho-N-acetylmuramoyl-pentapeptide-transfe